MNSFLEQIQNDIEQHLIAQPIFRGIPIISHQESNFENCLNEYVQTSTGLSILVLNPLPLRIVPVGNHISFEDIQLRIQVIESPCTNTLKRTALSTAEYVSKILHNYQPTLKNWKGWLTINELHPWQEIEDPKKSNRYIIEIAFHIKGSIKK